MRKALQLYTCSKCNGEFVYEEKRDVHFRLCDGTMPETIQKLMSIRSKRNRRANRLRRGKVDV